MTLRIATWNINSIKARLPLVLQWVEANQPDILFLQEIKCVNEDFPAEAFKALDYHSTIRGMKAYHGVATLSKMKLDFVVDHLPGDDTDDHARFLETRLNDLILINGYMPNGNPVDSPKYPYKLGWLDRLIVYCEELRKRNVPFLIGGDFNIIPEERDCFNPRLWEKDALFKPETRQRWRTLLNMGLYDAFRIHNQQNHQYTFWDYQGGAWQNDLGIRIDHFLLSPQLVDRMVSCTIDKTPRGWEKASDHVPVILELSH